MLVDKKKSISTAEVVLTIAVVAVLVFPRIAAAEYPEKSVRFVVQWAPTKLEQSLVQMIAEDFANAYDTPAVIVNELGAGPSALEVAESPADGYTVGFFVNGLPIEGNDIGVLGQVPDTFEPLGLFSTFPYVLVTKKAAPYSNMTALTHYATDNQVVLGHADVRLPPTRVTIAFAKNAGFEWGGMVEIANPDCDTLASGEADIVSTTLQRIMPCLNDVTIMASITEGRNPQLPDIPALGEIDSTLVLEFWSGLFVHKDTPNAVRDKIIDVAKATVLSERAQELTQDTGALVYWQDAEKAAQRIVVDRGTLVEINKITD